MATLGGNVLLFSNQRTDRDRKERNVYQSIQTYLERKSQNSENTARTYERSIRSFFKTMRNKELHELTEEDLVFNYEEVERYQNALKSYGYKLSTVNNTLSALSSLYKALEKYEYDVKSIWFDVERHDEYDSESYDSLNWEEVEQVLEFVNKGRKANEKTLLVELAVATSFRLDSLLSLTYADISMIDNVWVAETLGKGNVWDAKAINNELYAKVVKHMGDKNAKSDDTIISLSEKTVDRMMKDVRENLFEGRNVVFHSFKKAGIEEVARLTNNNVKAMQKQGNHKRASTTLDNYVKDEDDFSKMPSLEIGKKIDFSPLEELSKEELMELIKKSSRNTQMELLNLL